MSVRSALHSLRPHARAMHDEWQDAVPIIANPKGLTGLLVWLDANLGITLNGSNVSAWADQSGNGNNATQGTAAAQPAYSATGWSNGKAAISMVQSSGRQLVTPSISLGAFSIGIVGNFGINGYPIVHNTDAMPGFYMLCSNNKSIKVGRGATADGANYNAGWFTDNTNKSAIVTYNGTDATFLLYVNGVSVVLAGDGLNPGTAAQAGTLFISGNQTAATIPTGLLAEVDVYNRALSNQEVLSLYTYHKKTWATP